MNEVANIDLLTSEMTWLEHTKNLGVETTGARPVHR